MGFMDMIKKSVLEQFQSVTVGQMALSVGVAFLMGIFILLVYRQTFRGVLYSKGFAISLVLLAMVTALVIRTISSNLALSLGMVGALSIVRFRTAVKDARDTLYIFWSMVTGLSVGTQNFVLSFLSVCFISAVLFAFRLMGERAHKGTLIVRGPALDIPKLEEELSRRALHFRMQTSTVGEGHSECVYTVFLGRKQPAGDFAARLKGTAGVQQANWIRE